jgi:hypothetical protein
MREEKCDTCRYCDGWSCKRHAPIASNCGHSDKIYPRISRYFDWCGDWEKKVGEPEDEDI